MNYYLDTIVIGIFSLGCLFLIISNINKNKSKQEEQNNKQNKFDNMLNITGLIQVNDILLKNVLKHGKIDINKTEPMKPPQEIMVYFGKIEISEYSKHYFYTIPGFDESVKNIKRMVSISSYIFKFPMLKNFCLIDETTLGYLKYLTQDRELVKVMKNAIEDLPFEDTSKMSLKMYTQYSTIATTVVTTVLFNLVKEDNYPSLEFVKKLIASSIVKTKAGANFISSQDKCIESLIYIAAMISEIPIPRDWYVNKMTFEIYKWHYKNQTYAIKEEPVVEAKAKPKPKLEVFSNERVTRLENNIKPSLYVVNTNKET